MPVTPYFLEIEEKTYALRPWDPTSDDPMKPKSAPKRRFQLAAGNPSHAVWLGWLDLVPLCP
jgi:hypothetical protein